MGTSHCAMRNMMACTVTGQGAGTAAAVSIKEGVSTLEVDVKKVQEELKKKRINFSKMSESHFDQYEHYNYDQDKAIFSGHSGKQRSKKEAAMNTNKHNPGGHERKIVNKLMNA